MSAATVLVIEGPIALLLGGLAFVLLPHTPDVWFVSIAMTLVGVFSFGLGAYYQGRAK